MSNTVNIIPTPTPGEWTRELALLRAAIAAGFNCSGYRAVEVRTGIAWSVTLSYMGKKIAFASNSGSGGESMISLPPTTTVERAGRARQAMESGLDTLVSLAEVQAFLKADHDAVDGIDEAAPVARTNDRMGNVIATLAETKLFVASIRRSTKGKLAMVPKGRKLGDYACWAAEDTLENRARVVRQNPDRFVGYEGFVNDLVAGL
jgi:hypothetical protein